MAATIISLNYASSNLHPCLDFVERMHAKHVARKVQQPFRRTFQNLNTYTGMNSESKFFNLSIKPNFRRNFIIAGGLVSTLTFAVGVAATGAIAVAMLGSNSPKQQAIVATRRGMQKFINGDVLGSLEDFDLTLQLDPSQNPYLWQRGLSLYYANRFEEGSKQFRDDVAVNPNDTEEAIWCFLCEAKLKSLEEARKEFLNTGLDSRPVMREVYQLFKNDSSPDNLLYFSKHSQGGQKFYAKLYLGLFYEINNKVDLAKEEILSSLKTDYALSSGDYMVSVAKVHCQTRQWVV